MIIYIIGRQTLPTTVSKADTSYWLASRDLGYNDNMAIYYAHHVTTDGGRYADYLYNSIGFGLDIGNYGVRPVVYLKSDIQLSYDSSSGYTISE